MAWATVVAEVLFLAQELPHAVGPAKKKIIIKNKVVPTVAQQVGGVLGAGLIPSPAQWVTDLVLPQLQPRLWLKSSYWPLGTPCATGRPKNKK